MDLFPFLPTGLSCRKKVCLVFVSGPIAAMGKRTLDYRTLLHFPGHCARRR